jgi:hypothetical protein
MTNTGQWVFSRARYVGMFTPLFEKAKNKGKHKTTFFDETFSIFGMINKTATTN